MRRAVRVVIALFACGIVGSLYGAVLGGIYAVIYLGVDLHMGSQHVNAPQFVNFVTGAFGCGTIFGFPAGFISGVLGGSLGGPIGYCVGGFAGTTAVMLAGFGPYVGPVGIYPAVWGAAFGLVLGLHLYRQVPVLPGVSWLSRVIFGSPLGGRHGWRQR